jgi:N-methylhydantoinase B/oxoprolinase/acetone carboxylase alpha subunit
MAMVTGFTATPGTWNVNLSQSGASIVFDSTAAVTPVTTTPDGGSTLLMLGGGFLGLAGISRKRNC